MLKKMKDSQRKNCFVPPWARARSFPSSFRVFEFDVDRRKPSTPARAVFLEANAQQKTTWARPAGRSIVEPTVAFSLWRRSCTCIQDDESIRKAPALNLVRISQLYCFCFLSHCFVLQRWLTMLKSAPLVKQLLHWFGEIIFTHRVVYRFSY